MKPRPETWIRLTTLASGRAGTGRPDDRVIVHITVDPISMIEQFEQTMKWTTRRDAVIATQDPKRSGSPATTSMKFRNRALPFEA